MPENSNLQWSYFKGGLQKEVPPYIKVAKSQESNGTWKITLELLVMITINTDDIHSMLNFKVFYI